MLTEAINSGEVGVNELIRMDNITESNDLEADDDYYIFADPRVQVALILLYSIVFLFCFFGNLTVVLVIAFHRKMRGSTKFCLGNLAFANFCVGAFCIYQDLSLYLMENWVFGKFLCKMHHFTNKLAHTASVLILVVIAAERYFAVLHPFKCRRVLTIRRLRVIILCVWIISGIICSPWLYYAVLVINRLPTNEGEPRRYEVFCTLLSSDYDTATADLLQFILLFLLPLSVIAILYGKLGIFLRQRETFVCSFVQTSITSTTDVDISSEKIPKRASPRKYSTTNPEHVNRKVSFSHLSQQREDENQQTQCHSCDNVFASGSSKNSCSVSPNVDNCTAKTRRHNAGRVSELLNRKESCCGESSLSLNQDQVRRKSSAVAFIQSSNKGVIRMLIVILITFSLCNLPFHLRKLYQHFVRHRNSDGVWSDLATPLSFLLMYTNCAINPILYAFMSRSFRDCLRDCIRCRLRGRAANNINYC